MCYCRQEAYMLHTDIIICLGNILLIYLYKTWYRDGEWGKSDPTNFFDEITLGALEKGAKH